MNRPPLYAALSLALLALGCGGSTTSGSGTSSNVNLSNLTTPQIEAVFTTAGGSNVSGVANPVVEDARDIQVGDVIQFQLVAYDKSGGRHVLAASGWSSNDFSGQYGQLDSITGQFTTSSTAMSNETFLGTMYNGQLYEASYQTHPQQARLIGKIVDSSTGGPVSGVEVDFYSSDGQQVGKAATAYDGTFRASVPNDAVQFTLNPSTIGAAYWQSFAYGYNGTTYQYDAGSETCLAPINYYPVTWTSQQPSSSDATQLPLPVGASAMYLSPAGSSLFSQVLPASATDPGVIVLATRAGNPQKPQSSGCSG